MCPVWCLPARLHGLAQKLVVSALNTYETNLFLMQFLAAPKVDMASRRYFDASYLVTGSLWIFHPSRS